MEKNSCTTLFKVQKIFLHSPRAKKNQLTTQNCPPPPPSQKYNGPSLKTKVGFELKTIDDVK